MKAVPPGSEAACGAERTFNREMDGWVGDIGRILDTTIYTFLTALSDAVDVVVLKPVDVRL